MPPSAYIVSIRLANEMFAVNDLKKRKPSRRRRKRKTSGKNKQKFLHTYKIRSELAASSSPEFSCCLFCSCYCFCFCCRGKLQITSESSHRQFGPSTGRIGKRVYIAKKKNYEMCVALAVVDLILIASMNINTQEWGGRGFWLIGKRSSLLGRRRSRLLKWALVYMHTFVLLVFSSASEPAHRNVLLHLPPGSPH